jgi:hypothetical protein
VIGSAALIGAVLLFVTQRRVGTAPSA